MSTIKVTITLGTEEFARVRELVDQQQVANVSAFVQQAVRRSLDDVAGWAGVLAEALAGTGGGPAPREGGWEALAGTGGALTPEEVEWADEVLAGGGQPFEPPSQHGAA